MDANNNTSNQVFLNVLKYLIIFAPVIVYFSYVQQFALDLPRWDDYDAILDFLVRFKKAGFGGKLALFFEQHNEHRIFSSNVVYVLYQSIFGHISFRNLIFIDSIQLLLVFFILLQFTKRLFPTLWPVVALALSLCLFDLNNYENADFAMAGMQNYGILLLFFGSMAIYNSSNGWLTPLAVLMQATAVFSSGNGNVASFFIVLFLFLHPGKKKVKRTVALGCFLLMAPLYYVHYEKMPLGFFSTDPGRILPFFFHAVGAHFGYTLGLAMGVLLLAAYFFVVPLKRIIGKLSPEELFFLIVAAFVWSSMGIMAIFRAGLPPEGAYSSRYFIYSHLLVFIFFAFLLKRTEGRANHVRIATMGVLLLAATYRKNYNEGVAGFESNYRELISTDFFYPDRERAIQVTDEACKLHIYCIQEARGAIKR